VIFHIISHFLQLKTSLLHQIIGKRLPAAPASNLNPSGHLLMASHIGNVGIPSADPQQAVQSDGDAIMGVQHKLYSFSSTDQLH
jgi:hypothetical protein